MEVEIPCDRCLKPVITPLHLSFEDKVDMKISESQRIADLDEHGFLHGYDLDVDELVSGAALLEWPTRTLCRDDCKGLCPVCGQDLNAKECGCNRAPIDPRMARIQEIFKQDKEV